MSAKERSRWSAPRSAGNGKRGPGGNHASKEDGLEAKAEEQVSTAALVEQNIPLARYVLRKVASHLPPHMDRDDLLSAGLVGLVDAASKFDPGRNIKFQTYAVPRIRGAIMDDLREQDWLPRSARDEVSRVKGAILSLRQKRDRDPTQAELASCLRMPKARVARLLRVMHTDGFRSLDHVSEDGEYPGQERWTLVAGASIPSPEERLELGEQKEMLARELTRIPEQERTVITLYYFENLLLREIGEVMNLSDSRVCQIHHSALARLRNVMGKELLETARVG